MSRARWSVGRDSYVCVDPTANEGATNWPRVTGQEGEDWVLFRWSCPNVLLEGSVPIRKLSRLVPYLRVPLRHWHPRQTVTVPVKRMGTLVIWGVDQLTVTQQRELLVWSDADVGTEQVISIAVRPVFRMVQRGEFIEALYYRLNHVCL